MNVKITGLRRSDLVVLMVLIFNLKIEMGFGSEILFSQFVV